MKSGGSAPWRAGHRTRSRGAAWGCLIAFAAAATVGADESGFVLDLPGGGRLPGSFVETPAGDGPRRTLAWRSPLFTAPLEFWLDEITGVRSTAAAAAPDQARGFSCRLRGGDIIDGELRGIDERQIVIEPVGGEPLRVDRSFVTSLVRRKAGGTAGYVGPGGLVGWTQAPESSWRDEAGRLVSDVANSSVARDVGGPVRARYDIVLSWRRKPELSLAVAAADGRAVDPYRFEMLAAQAGGPVAVLIRQDERGGMLEPLEVPVEEQGRLQMTLFVDQAAGRVAAAAAGMERLVDLTVPPAAGRKPSGRFRLQLMSGDVCLERLRVSEWKSPEPVMGDPDMTRITMRDGSVVEGEVVSLDGDGALAVKTKAGPGSRGVAELDEIAFATGEQTDADPAAVRIVRRDGGVLSGDILAVGGGKLTVGRPGIDRPVAVPLTDVHSIVSLRAAEPRPLPGRVGILKLGDAEVAGCLVDAAAWGGGLAWQPRGCATGSPVAETAGGGVSAVVEYVPRSKAVPEPQAGQVEIGGIGGVINPDEQGFFFRAMLNEEGAAARDGRIEPGDRILAIRPTENGPFVEAKGLELSVVMNLLRGRVGTPVGLRIARPDGGQPKRIDLVRGLIYVADRAVLDEALAVHARVGGGQAAVGGEVAGFPARLVLRSGDIVPAAVDRIDAAGITLRSPATAVDGREAVVVPQPLVRAIEFDPVAASRPIERPQWERLLTLPRSQQADPPTHLLRLRSGDYLRGRLESLDDEAASFTVLGQPKRIPREAVVRVIWLHADEIEGRPADPKAVAPAAAARDDDDPRPPPGLLVQGIAASSGRTTMFAERLEGAVIVGTSLALGPSRIDTQAIDRLLVGRAVGGDGEELPFARWRLRPAARPRALRDEK